MTRTKFDSKAEMRALALSNIFSGALGGLPVTAALARTSVTLLYLIIIN